MDIILNTRFNNANLPIVQRPGFTADFAGAAGNITLTDDGKPWEFRSAPWTLNGDGTASGGAELYADGLSANGTVETKISQVNPGGSDLRAGLVLRAVDARSYIRYCFNTVGAPTLYVIENDQSTQAGTATGYVAQDGDILTAVMSGSTITCLLNGETVLTREVETFKTATRHGLYSNGANAARFDYVNFTSA